MTGFPTKDFAALVPVAILTAGAVALLLSEVFLVSGRRTYQALLTVAVAAAAGFWAAWAPVAGPVFGGQGMADNFSAFVTVIVCAGLGLSALVGAGWLKDRNAERGEFYALALFGAAGMSLLGMANDFLSAFVAIETMSISTYALAAYLRRGKRPAEAAFKYLVLGAISSALFLYGAALLYGASGSGGAAPSTLFSALSRAQGSALYLPGLGLVVGGLAFKIAAVPFHAWTPDVYEGAPTPVTAFMAAGVKTAAFAVLARVFLAASTGGEAQVASFTGIVVGLAGLTMIFGNLLALPQRSVKRMLAYSSIAHAGYLLIGVVAAGAPGVREKALAGILFYLVAYSATAIGAFAIVGALERKDVGDDERPDAWDVARFAGLARKRPVLAFSMAVFLLSLAGIPPTAGFLGKLYIFQAAIGANRYGLAVLGILTSVLGAYYYLRVVVFMYMRPPEGEAEASSPAAVSVALAAAVAVVVLLGIVADPIVRLANVAGAMLL